MLAFIYFFVVVLTADKKAQELQKGGGGAGLLRSNSSEDFLLSDKQSLVAGEWLTDAVIDCAQTLLKEHYPHIYVY